MSGFSQRVFREYSVLTALSHRRCSFSVLALYCKYVASETELKNMLKHLQKQHFIRTAWFRKSVYVITLAGRRKQRGLADSFKDLDDLSSHGFPAA